MGNYNTVLYLLIYFTIIAPYVRPGFSSWFCSCIWSEVETLTAGCVDITCLDVDPSSNTYELCDLGKVT